MKEKGDKTGILPSAEQMNEWVKESRENVFHPMQTIIQKKIQRN